MKSAAYRSIVKPPTTAPHTKRLRHLKVERVNADFLAQVARARRTWDDIELERDKPRKSWGRA